MKTTDLDAKAIPTTGDAGESMPMDAAERAELEARGYEVFDHAADALGLDDVERAMIDLRVDLVARIRVTRSRAGISQAELARRMKTSRPAVARLESGDIRVGLATLIEAWAALGGRISPTGPSEGD